MDTRTDQNEHGQPIGYPLPNWTPPPFPPHSLIEGKFCVLEPFDPSIHGADLYAANAADADGTNWTYLPYGPFPGFGEYKDWLETVCTQQDPQFYAIQLKFSGTVVGLASYLRIDPKNSSIEVGHIYYSPPLQRTPAATEAMYLMMKNAFELGYRRYEWKCDSLNAPSCAAAQRLGFSFEGIFRQATVYKGRNRDTAWFAVIDEEWSVLEVAFQGWLSPDNFDVKGKQRISLRELTGPILKKVYHG